MAELQYLVFEDITKKLLISQYQKPNFQSLMRIISKIFSDIQDNNFLLRDLFWLEDATGEQLNFLGRLWDVKRSGKDDSSYRAAIYVKIEQTASGIIEEIRNSLIQNYGATSAHYIPMYPAGYIFETDADITQAKIEAISPAGVAVLYYDPDEAGNEWFARHTLKEVGDERTWYVSHDYQPYQRHLSGNTNFFADHDEVLYNFHNGQIIALHG